ncbi:MAG: T9SS type A sorting domain-containing protein [Bacteroidia bacterium]
MMKLKNQHNKGSFALLAFVLLMGMKKGFAILFYFILINKAYCQQITFQKLYLSGFPGPINLRFELVQTSDKGYLTGSTMQLLLTDSLGQLQWYKQFSNGPFAVSFISIGKLSDGYILIGSDNLMKIDNNYNIDWIMNFPALPGSTIVRQTPDKGFIIMGYYAFLIKTDSLGTVQWSKLYDMPLGASINSITLTPDGGYMMAGSAQYILDTTSTTSDIFVMKTDSLGNSLWAKHYLTPNTSSICYHITTTSDGNFVLAVRRYPHELLLKIDTAGNILWEKYYAAELNGAFRRVRETSDGGLIALGDMEGIDSGWVERTCLLVKTDSAGNLQWARELGGYWDMWAADVRQTEDGGYVLAARRAGDGISIIKTDSLGHTNGCLEGVPIVTVTSITTDTIIPIPVTDSIVTVTGVLVTLSDSLIGSEITLCPPVSVPEVVTNEEEFLIFPNPFTNQITITSNFNNGDIDITNLLGEKVFQTKLSNQQGKIELSHLSQGMYFLSVKTKEKVFCRKIVKPACR